MKHWCHFSRVVSYLERVEAGVPDNTPKGRYLVWTDEDGPHMIAGPGIHWYRGDGPMPDLDSLELPVRARNASDGSATARRSLSKPETPTRRSLRTRPDPNATRPRCKQQERKLARQNSSQKRLKVSHVKRGEQKANTFLKSGYSLYSSCETELCWVSQSGGRGGCPKTFRRTWWSSPNGLPPSRPVVSICSTSAGRGVSFVPIVRPPRAGQQPARPCIAAPVAGRPLQRRERSCTTRGCR